MPTILDLLGLRVDVKINDQFQGESLTPLFRGERKSYDVFSETDYRYAIFKKSLRTYDGWKLIKDMEKKTDEVYDLGRDKSEKDNLTSKNKDKLELLDKAFGIYISY